MSLSRLIARCMAGQPGNSGSRKNKGVYLFSCSLSGYYPVVISGPGQSRRSPMLTFATKTLSTGANGQKADGTSPFVRAVLKKLSWLLAIQCRLDIHSRSHSSLFLFGFRHPSQHLPPFVYT